MLVLIDGEAHDPADAALSVFDWAVVRGFGVFEVIRSYGGRPFRLGPHLDRLGRSAAGLGIDPPDRAGLEQWVEACADDGGDCQVRVIVTGGRRDRHAQSPPRTIVMTEPLADVPDRLRILPMRAPWHPATQEEGFGGIKWTSYAPNMASTEKAHLAGFDDALLLSADGIVLEGPTFTVAWASGGRLETPSMELGILASITRDVMLEAAARLSLEVVESAFPLQRVLDADEVLALSTVKQVTPVERIGDQAVEVGEISTALAAEFAAIVAAEVGAGPS